MIIHDFSHLSARNLHTAISQARPQKIDGKFDTDSFFQFYMHLMLNSLRASSVKFRQYGDIILALDARGGNWRKDEYEDYKGHRKKNREESDIDYESFFKRVNEFTEVLQEIFPYKVVHVKKAEGDDVIGVLAKKYAPLEKTVVITSDKDMKQVLEYGCDLYDPIKQKYIRMSNDEIKAWKVEHILCGDSGDNIPHIKRGTQFTDNFQAYLKNEDIFLKEFDKGGRTVTLVEQFHELAIGPKLIEDYDVWKTTKKDGTFKDIWKPTPFGTSGAAKFAVELRKNLLENPLYARHFKRNKELVLFEHIPEWLQKDILDEYDSVEMTHNSAKIFEFLTKNSLTKLVMDISDFELSETQRSLEDVLEEW